MTTEAARVAAFWESHPCGDGAMGGLKIAYRGDYETFFTAYDRMRYAIGVPHPGLPRCYAGVRKEAP